MSTYDIYRRNVRSSCRHKSYLIGQLKSTRMSFIIVSITFRFLFIEYFCAFVDLRPFKPCF